jgi:hypothetical protein
MLNKIVDGISIKLSQVFSDSYEISSEKVEQGFKEPCFFIKLLSDNSRPLLGNRYSFSVSVNIRYHSDKHDVNEDMNSVAMKLYSALESITVNDKKIVGSDLHRETVDEVLHMFVTYKMILKKSELPSEVMKEVKVITKVKEGGDTSGS